MRRGILISFLLTLWSGMAFAQVRQDSLALVHVRWSEEKIAKGVVVKTAAVRLFGSDQQVTLLEYNPLRYRTRIVQADTMSRVSELSRQYGAIGAINGSFYNMRTGWPVTFIRSGGTGYGPVSVEDPMLNGAIVVSNNGIKILPWQCETIREIQTGYPDVMQAGPLMIYSGLKQPIQANPGMAKRHPRTALGITKRGVLFVVVDGRHEGHAEGMTLEELAWLMSQLGCIDALNLDGGGSSALWANAIRNFPSDNGRFDHEGERAVSNAILIVDI